MAKNITSLHDDVNEMSDVVFKFSGIKSFQLIIFIFGLVLDLKIKINSFLRLRLEIPIILKLYKNSIEHQKLVYFVQLD